MQEHEIKDIMSRILSLNDKQQNLFQDIKPSMIVNKKYLKKELQLSKTQSELLDNVYKFHQNLEAFLKAYEKQVINYKEDAIEIIEPYMSSLQEEQLLAIYINNRREIIETRIITVGSIVHTVMDALPIFKYAFRCNAQGIIIAHNHPGGVAEFTEDDIVATQSIDQAADTLNIRLIDHIVYAPGDGFASFRNLEKELYDEDFQQQ